MLSLTNFERILFFSVAKRRYVAYLVSDGDSSPPWKNSDFHGVVLTHRKPLPGNEVDSSELRYLGRVNGYYTYYDVPATKLKAVSVWGLEAGSKKLQREVDRDFAYLRAFCTDKWHYCGLIVYALDSKGFVMQNCNTSLWLIPSNESDNYLLATAKELALEITPPTKATKP